MLGVSPAAGRLFGLADSEEPGAAPVTVLSHRFWTRRFNADPSIVGSTVRINEVAYTVIGVAPKGFQGTGVTAGDSTGAVPHLQKAASSSDAATRERAVGILRQLGKTP